VNGLVTFVRNAVIGVLVAILSTSALAGDREEGFAAFNRKNWPVAHRLLRPLAENGDARAQNAIGSCTRRVKALIATMPRHTGGFDAPQTSETRMLSGLLE
jgi:hypothetical protein